jgi:nicotinamidase/pyrazinamidase
VEETMRKVLLVIDMLNDFMDPAGALYCGDEARKIIPAVKALIADFIDENQPVIYLRDAHSEDDKEFAVFSRHAVKNTWGSQIIPELEPPAGSVVVDKTRFSGFYGNRLGEILAAEGPDEVWITGVCTSICVMDTAGDSRNRDYSVVIPTDAVADFDREAHEMALKRMLRVYGVKLATVQELLGGSGRRAPSGTEG